MILTPNDILDQLKKLVQEKFPGEDVHLNLCPQGFSRPCTLIELDGCPGSVGYGCQTVELRPTVRLTTFVEVDEYHHSHLAELHLRQMVLLGLFLPGYIKVKDRAVKVAPGDQSDELIRLEGGLDFDTVTVPLTYTLDRSEFENISTQPPMMGELHIRQEVATYG